MERVRGPLTDRLADYLSGVSAATGENYFNSLVRYLGAALEVDVALVARVSPGREPSLQVCSACVRGKLRPAAEYDAFGTPFAEVIDAGVAVDSATHRGGFHLFPFYRRTVQGYAAVPVRDASGAVLGVLAILHAAPLPDPSFASFLLDALAPRVASELLRQQAQEIGQENERRLATLLANLPGLVYRCRIDATWTTEFVSEGCLALTGYTPEELCGNRRIAFVDMIHPDDREWAIREIRRALDADRPFQLNYRILTATGEEKWVWEQGRGISAPNGEIIAIEGFVTDMTDHMRAQEALRQGEERLRAVTDTMNGALFTFDESGLIESVNRAAIVLFGYAREEMVGRSIATLLPGVMARVGRVADPRLPQELKGTGKNGREFPVDAFLNEMHLGGRRMHVCVARDSTLRRQAEALNARLGRILDDSSNEIYVFHADSLAIIQANQGACRNLGYTADELKSLAVVDLKPQFDRERFEALIAPVRTGEQDTLAFETAHRRKDGTEYAVEVRLHLSRAETPPVFVAVVQDISERRRAHAEMHKLSSALQQTADLIMITNRRGVIEYVNPAFEATTGYASAEAIGKTPRLIKSGKHDKAFYKALWGSILEGKVFRDVLVNRRKDGELYYEEKTITPLKDAQGNVTHFISSGRDITERMQIQERLHFLAHHDPLTGLPNRVMFLARLDQAIARSRWNNRPLAVLFIDLDRFKMINDTLGHDIGDRALQLASERLRGAVRSSDTVARLAGDEFTVLLENISLDHIPIITRKILDTLVQPYLLQGREFFMTASIGISVFPSDGNDPLTLLGNADIAMYRAKEVGRNNFKFYSAEMSAKAYERLTVETSLRHALEREELVLHYQPQIDLVSGTMIGVEALVRWQHPELGLVPPAQFISIAEETGLIVAMGEWILRKACAQARAWKDAGLVLPVAVNLSARQFSEPTLVPMVRAALRETRLDAQLLELEITENVVMQNVAENVDTMTTLSTMGVRLAIDDFGMGYSSLSYLKRFPIDTLKIDQSFVRDITVDADDEAIVAAMIALAHNLDLCVVAEGVETHDQLEFLRRHRCDRVQGYLLARPLPQEEITAFAALPAVQSR